MHYNYSNYFSPSLLRQKIIRASGGDLWESKSVRKMLLPFYILGARF